MSKTIKAVKLTRGLKANAKGSLPTEIEVVRTGYWSTPWHGEFEITTYDIDEAVDHFNAGVYRVQGTEPLPGTLDHLGGNSPAAFRITAVRREGEAMIASVEWTALGKEKLERDEYRYVSFEFFPRSMPFENPEKEGEMLVNVLTGATLTNDPLFKKLKPVMASVDAGNSDKPTKEGGDMDLEEVRVKKLEDLTDEEKQFLTEHKQDLTDEERTTFQLAEEEPTEPTEPAPEPTEPVAPTEPAEPTEPTEPVQASANGGLTAAEIKQLRADAQAGREAAAKLARKEAQEFVAASVAKGRIKSDTSNEAVELLLASAGDQRKNLEKFIESLPENPLLAEEHGSGDADEGASAMDKVFAQAQELMSKGDHKTIGDATRAVLKADAGLAKRFQAEQEESK